MKQTQIFIITCVLSLTVLSCAQSPTSAPFIAPSLKKNTQTIYEDQKALAQNKDATTDFSVLRKAYTGTEQYDPWNSREHEAGLVIIDAFNEGQYERCVKIAEATLAYNYANLIGHFGHAACHSALGNIEKSELHAWILQGLIDSINASGDGKTQESAYVCISSTEMRHFVQLVGLVMYRQENIFSGVKQIEAVHAFDSRTEENVVLYFDTSAAREHSFLNHD